METSTTTTKRGFKQLSCVWFEGFLFIFKGIFFLFLRREVNPKVKLMKRNVIGIWPGLNSLLLGWSPWGKWYVCSWDDELGLFKSSLHCTFLWTSVFITLKVDWVMWVASASLLVSSGDGPWQQTWRYYCSKTGPGCRGNLKQSAACSCV